MGHYRSEIISDEQAKEEAEEFARIREAHKLFDELKDIPTSQFTFGELSFLLYFQKSRRKYGVDTENLERLREIVARTTAEAPS